MMIELTGKSINGDDLKHVLPHQGIGPFQGSLLLLSVFWLPPAPPLLLCLAESTVAFSGRCCPPTTPSLAVITTLAFAVDFAGEIVNVAKCKVFVLTI